MKYCPNCGKESLKYIGTLYEVEVKAGCFLNLDEYECAECCSTHYHSEFIY